MHDYNAMKEDAVKRAIEMQSKAQMPQARIENTKKEKDKKENRETVKQIEKQEEKKDVFSMLFKDSEKALLLVLLILLSSENADPSLIFAVLYLCI